MWPVGEIASLGAALCWAIGLTLFRRDVREIGARAVNLFKGILGSAGFLLVLALGAARSVPADAQALLALSGLLGLALGDTLLFHALARLGAHRTALVASLGPVMTATGGWLFLDEALTAYRTLGIVMAVAGVTMVVYFRRAAAEPEATMAGVLYAVLAAACHASGVLLTKRGLEDADPLAATALRLVTATAILAVVGLWRRDLRTDLTRLVRPGPVLRLVPAALFGTFFGLWLMQIGIAYTRESAVANALHSTTPLFTLPIAVLVLRERLGVGSVAGSLLAVAGVVLLLLN